MHDITGEYWDVLIKNRFDVAVCTTNQVLTNEGCLVMGGGIAKEFKLRFENYNVDLPRCWGKQLETVLESNFKSALLITHNYDDYDLECVNYIVGMPTKYHWKDKSDINLIKTSCEQLALASIMLDWNRILIPRPGCGLGGLKWDDVKPVLQELLDDRFYVIGKEN